MGAMRRPMARANRRTGWIAATLVLTACSPASGDTPQAQDRPLDAVRISLLTVKPAAAPTAAAIAPQERTDKPQWTATPTGAVLAYVGEAPLLSIACKGERLIVTRHAPADPGAQALFALIGSGTTLRLPVNATPFVGADQQVWQGDLAASDPKAAVFLRGSVAATLPGAGKITLPASDISAGVVRRCGGAALPSASEAPTSQAPADAETA